MAEPWQWQLKALRTLEMPASVRERMEAGPTGEGFPPRRDRVFAGIVGFAVLVAVGALAWIVFGGTSAPEPHLSRGTVAVVTVTGRGTTAEPSATLRVGDATPVAAIHECVGVGKVHPRRVPPEIDSFVALATGTPLESQSNEVFDQAWAFLADPRTLDGMEGTAGALEDVAGRIFNVPPGRYVLVIQWGSPCEGHGTTRFSGSESARPDASLLTFYFGIEVVPPGSG